MKRQQIFNLSDSFTNLGRILDENEINNLYNMVQDQTKLDVYKQQEFYNKYDIWDIVLTMKNISKEDKLYDKLNRIFMACEYWDAHYKIKPYNLPLSVIREQLNNLNKIYAIFMSSKNKYSKALDIVKIYKSSKEFTSTLNKYRKYYLKDKRLWMSLEALKHFDDILEFYKECEIDRRNPAEIKNERNKKNSDTIFNDVLYHDSKYYYYYYFEDARNIIKEYMEYGFNSLDEDFFAKYNISKDEQIILSQLICSYIDTNIYEEVDSFRNKYNLSLDEFKLGVELMKRQNRTGHALELNEYLLKHNFTENDLIRFQKLINEYIDTPENIKLNEFLINHNLLEKKYNLVGSYAKEYGCDKIYDFLRSKSMTNNDFNMCVKIVDELDVDFYNKYEKTERFNKKIAVVANKSIFEDLAFGIEYGMLADGTEFNLLVFLKKLPFKYSSDCYKLIRNFLNEHCFDVKNVILKYMDKFLNLNYFKNFESMAVRKNIYATSMTMYINGELVAITESNKDNIIKYLDKNSIPLIMSSFNYAMEHYLKGELNIDQPFTYVKK